MIGRRALPIAALALVAMLALAGTAAADHAEPAGRTSTGDVDTYQAAYYTTAPACPSIYTTWEVELTLLHPFPGDRVLLSSQGTVVRAAGAAVATYEDPTATLRVDWGGCPPPTEVVGLTVDGDRGYTISATNLMYE